MTRDELEAEQRHNDLVEQLAAAKAAVNDGDDSDEAHARLADAKQQISEFRCNRRSVNPPDASASADDGVAAPATVQVTTEGG